MIVIDGSFKRNRYSKCKTAHDSAIRTTSFGARTTPYFKPSRRGAVSFTPRIKIPLRKSKASAQRESRFFDLLTEKFEFLDDIKKEKTEVLKSLSNFVECDNGEEIKTVLAVNKDSVNRQGCPCLAPKIFEEEAEESNDGGGTGICMSSPSFLKAVF